MQNEKLTTVDYRGTWNRHTPWLPWMLMGQMPGHIQYNCFMGNCDDLEEVLHRQVLDYAEKNYKKYFTAPRSIPPSAACRAWSTTQSRPSPSRRSRLLRTSSPGAGTDSGAQPGPAAFPGPDPPGAGRPVGGRPANPGQASLSRPGPVAHNVP